MIVLPVGPGRRGATRPSWDSPGPVRRMMANGTPAGWDAWFLGALHAGGFATCTTKERTWQAREKIMLLLSAPPRRPAPSGLKFQAVSDTDRMRERKGCVMMPPVITEAAVKRGTINRRRVAVTDRREIIQLQNATALDSCARKNLSPRRNGPTLPCFSTIRLADLASV